MSRDPGRRTGLMPLPTEFAATWSRPVPGMGMLRFMGSGFRGCGEPDTVTRPAAQTCD